MELPSPVTRSGVMAPPPFSTSDRPGFFAIARFAIASPAIARTAEASGAVVKACRPDRVRPRPLMLQLLSWLSALLIPLLGFCQPLWAAPVQWKEVTATADGRQWWDEGSLRINREGYLTVLSRFQPAAPAIDSAAEAPAVAGAQPAVAEATPAAAQAGSTAASTAAPGDQRRVRQLPSTLYVMEIDCDQALYRDTSINGFHQFSPEWQPVMADDLIGEVITQACAAAPLA